MTQNALLRLSPRARTVAWAMLAVGALTAIYGVIASPQRAWPNLLLNGFYITTLGVSAMFFLATQRASGARWSASLRRIPEAFLPMLPAAAALMILLFLGRHVLYPWSTSGALASEAAFAGKLRYLQPSWVLTRMVAVLGLWIVFAWMFRRISLQQDARPELALALHQKLTRHGVMFIPVFALTLTVAAFDWLISMDPRWFSTMYAVYVFAGTFVQGIAAVTLAAVLLKERGLLGPAVSEDRLHDLGKMLFAFSTFWAYIWVCQYLLIWYGNIPDEITYYLSRTRGPWLYLFALNLVANWVIPFVVLLPVRTKRSRRALKVIAMLVLGGHWLDLYLLIMPSVWPAPRVGLIEVFTAGGYLALVFLVFVRSLASVPLVPQNDPVLTFERAHGSTGHERVQASFVE
jgi:hypothetical protein